MVTKIGSESANAHRLTRAGRTLGDIWPSLVTSVLELCLGKQLVESYLARHLRPFVREVRRPPTRVTWRMGLPSRSKSSTPQAAPGPRGLAKVARRNRAGPGDCKPLPPGGQQLAPNGCTMLRHPVTAGCSPHGRRWSRSMSNPVGGGRAVPPRATPSGPQRVRRLRHGGRAGKTPLRDVGKHQHRRADLTSTSRRRGAIRLHEMAARA